MARKGYGFSDRFPHFGIFLVIAVAIAIPLTVWSLNNASTNTRQYAQASKCGPSNQNPSCPIDYKCLFTANNPLLGGTCNLSALNAPKNPRASTSCQYNPDNPNIAVFSLTWNPVDNATDYKVYGSYYYADQTNLVTTKVGPYTATTNSYTLTIPLPHNAKYFYWYVKANNASFKVTSASSVNSAIILDCH
jgi:hypothetical protein